MASRFAGFVFGTVLLCGCGALHSKWPDAANVALPRTDATEEPVATRQLADPSNQALQIALATARLAEERSMDAEAIAAYEEARRLDPAQPGLSHALAVLYDRAAMTDAAKREYSAALEEAPKDVNVLCDYGYFLYSTGMLAESEATLRRGLVLDSKHQQTQINLAVLLATTKRYEEAQQLFEEAIGPAAALHNIGIFKVRSGETEEGQRMIAAALRQDPSIETAGAVLEHVASEVSSPLLATGTGSLDR